MKTETTKETPVIMENIIFCSISSQNLGKSKPSQILPLLKIIADHWKLNLNIPV